MNLYVQVDGPIIQNLFGHINFIQTLSQYTNKVIGIDQIELEKKNYRIKYDLERNSFNYDEMMDNSKQNYTKDAK